MGRKYGWILHERVAIFSQVAGKSQYPANTASSQYTDLEKAAATSAQH